MHHTVFPGCTYLHGVLVVQGHLQRVLQLAMTFRPDLTQVVPCAVQLQHPNKCQCFKHIIRVHQDTVFTAIKAAICISSELIQFQVVLNAALHTSSRLFVTSGLSVSPQADISSIPSMPRVSRSPCRPSMSSLRV